MTGSPASCSVSTAGRIARAIARGTLVAAAVPLVCLAPIWIDVLIGAVVLQNAGPALWLFGVLIGVPLAFALVGVPLILWPGSALLDRVGRASALSLAALGALGGVALVELAAARLELPFAARLVFGGFGLASGGGAGLTWWDGRPGGSPPPPMFG